MKDFDLEPCLNLSAHVTFNILFFGLGFLIATMILIGWRDKVFYYCGRCKELLNQRK